MRSLTRLVTLLVPTKNRSDFLKRLLVYHLTEGFEGQIAIADSSDPPDAQATVSAIEAIGGRLNVWRREYPGWHDGYCTKELLRFVSTPYVAFHADDDFLVPETMASCVEFLEGAADYSAAHGRAIMFHLDTPGPWGLLQWVSAYPQWPQEASSAAERFRDLLGHYCTTLFAVHRTDVMRAMYARVDEVSDATFGRELLPCCLSVIPGKRKQVDGLYLARQGHDRRYLLPTVYEWVTGAEWRSSYLVFTDTLTSALVRYDQIDEGEALRLVKEAFWGYLAGVLFKKWPGELRQRRPSRSDRLREVLRGIPGLQRAWQVARAAMWRDGRSVSLGGLLSPWSRDHRDFMGIARAVSSPSSGAFRV
jgi:glycosyltransferase domain-containing protein